MEKWWVLSPEEEIVLQAKLREVSEKYRDHRRNHRKRIKSHEMVVEEIGERIKGFYAGKETVRIENLSSDLRVNWAAAFDGVGVLPVKVTIHKQRKTVINYGSLPFRMDNLEEVTSRLYHQFNGEPLIKGSFEVMQVKVPKHQKGYYHILPMLKRTGLQLRYLNPDITLNELDDYLSHLMSCYALYLPAEWHVHKTHLLTEVMQIPFGEIEPMTTKINTLWNPDYDLTVSERRSILLELRQKAKGNKTLQDLQQLYITMEGPTQKQMAEVSGKNIRTIKRYWGQIVENQTLLAA
ncbi:hypothetical protein [Allomuricauda sp. M10]|uniref:hypothetical protein n=1 Tax=Allomuricauda sp. M10 TaxID=2683292 RepID=UPI001D197A97|nr:hypothetical protein [Muricauda sp. M10]